LDEERIWRLHRGDELIAELHVTDSDFPWLIARVEARPGYATVRPLFDEEIACMKRELAGDPDGTDAWEAAYRRIRAAVRLTDPDGKDVPEFLMHIEDDEASWRWSDEAFEE
jgi:hypothetical protein